VLKVKDSGVRAEGLGLVNLGGGALAVGALGVGLDDVARLALPWYRGTSLMRNRLPP